MALNKTVFIWLIIVYSGMCDRVRDRIYYDIPQGNITQCYRRLNATHQIGCASKQKGNVGVFHYIPGEAELTWLIDHGPHKPYIVLLTPETFNIDFINRLSISGKVDGVIVSSPGNESSERGPFSPDTNCPNADSELYKGDSTYGHCKKTEWNPTGNELLTTDIKFPIILALNATHTDFLITQCYQKFNRPVDGKAREYPLCGAQIQAGMDAVKDTPTCMNRGKTRNMNPQTFCDPMGDNNVYSFLHPIPIVKSEEFQNTLANGSVIVAAAKLDATGLFQYIVPGAHSTVVGFISLLAAAEALGRVKKDLQHSKPIMFTFFQGESFDYMGSIRMLYDMERGQFPYKPEPNSEGIHPIHPYHISDILEINQVAAPSAQTLFLHSDPRSQQNIKVKDAVTTIEDLLIKYGQDAGLKIQATQADLPLPPASVQTFLKKTNVSSVVLTDFEKEYENKYYNSYADIPSNLNYRLTTNDSQTETTDLSEHLTNIATVVARTLYNMSAGHEYSGDLQANGSLVAQMLYCFFLTPQCDLFNMTVDEKTAEKLPFYPYSFYVGISRQTNPVTNHVQKLLAYFTGDIVNVTKSDCQNYDEDDKKKKHPRSPFYNYMWMNGPVNETSPDDQRLGLCVLTTANTSSGQSPAFIDGHDLSTTEYPAWSESIWATGVPHVRAFLIPDKSYEIRILCVGIAVLVACLTAVFLVNRRASLLFATE